MADIYDSYDLIVEEYNEKFEKLTTMEEKMELYNTYIQKLLDYDDQ